MPYMAKVGISRFLIKLTINLLINLQLFFQLKQIFALFINKAINLYKIYFILRKIMKELNDLIELFKNF
jgi:hypothetical protein